MRSEEYGESRGARLAPWECGGRLVKIKGSRKESMRSNYDCERKIPPEGGLLCKLAEANRECSI
jgi:hypothetical protein